MQIVKEDKLIFTGVTRKEGDSSDNFHEKLILLKVCCQIPNPRVVNRILTKLSSLIHLYSSFLQFPNCKVGHTSALN